LIRVAGYRRLTANGHFIQPESAREAVDDIETLGSPVKAFVRDCCEVGPGLSVMVDNLFEKWREWCVDEGRKDPGTKEWFGRNPHSTIPGLRVTKPRVGDERTRTYEGIALRPEHEPRVMLVPTEPEVLNKKQARGKVRF
jgi:putative DNA primase/helicase